MEPEASQTRLKNIGKPLLIITGIWILYTILFLSLKSHGSQMGFVAKLMPFTFCSILYLTAICFSFSLWKNAPAQSRTPFMLLTFAFCCLLTDGIIYHLMYNFLQIPHSQAPAFLVSLDNLAFIGYSIFTLSFLIYVLPKNKIKNKLWIVFTALIVLAFFAVSFFTQSQTNAPLTYKSFNVLEAFLDLISFAVAILCLAVSKNKGLFFIALGHAVGMAVDMSFDFQLFSQSYNIGSIMETLWIAMGALKVYGLICFKNSLSYKESPQNWVSAPNSIRAQSTFLAFLLSTGSLCLFYGVNHLFSAGKIFF